MTDNIQKYPIPKSLRASLKLADRALAWSSDVIVAGAVLAVATFEWLADRTEAIRRREAAAAASKIQWLQETGTMLRQCPSPVS